MRSLHTELVGDVIVRIPANMQKMVKYFKPTHEGANEITNRTGEGIPPF